jgi:hypothetical protein
MPCDLVASMTLTVVLQSSDMVDARAVADSMALDETYDMMEEERSIARPKRYATNQQYR